ncbi:MAG: ABC transporter ATP-binding protein [Patescibacteria group bacterium]|nr:ABC transporter ATP-binding protein [Patescibacteria group bacterium]
MNGVNKSYGGRQAVRDLNLSVAKGEFFGFLGPNGAGKTTTIRLMTGILKPDTGEIEISGKPVSEKSHRSDKIGVLSESKGLYEWMTGREFLRFFVSLYGVKNLNGRIDELLAAVGLADRADSPVLSYSRGMKQRLKLARAIANDPEILFLDEPTLGLDPQGQEDIQRLLKKMNDKGMTIFYSSHLLHEVSRLCNRMAVIADGALVADGTLEDLRRQTKKEDLRDIFLALTK